MRLLLDTHVLLWWFAGDPTLRDDAREAIADEDTLAYASAVSAWEIEIKRVLGRLDAPEDLREMTVRHRFTALPITFEHARRFGTLAPLHRDPFDRMLVAQAQVEGLTIVTRDRRVASYDVATLAA